MARDLHWALASCDSEVPSTHLPGVGSVVLVSAHACTASDHRLFCLGGWLGLAHISTHVLDAARATEVNADAGRPDRRKIVLLRSNGFFPGDDACCEQNGKLARWWPAAGQVAMWCLPERRLRTRYDQVVVSQPPWPRTSCSVFATRFSSSFFFKKRRNWVITIQLTDIFRYRKGLTDRSIYYLIIWPTNGTSTFALKA